jgi:hypothetical protein
VRFLFFIGRGVVIFPFTSFLRRSPEKVTGKVKELSAGVSAVGQLTRRKKITRRFITGYSVVAGQSRRDDRNPGLERDEKPKDVLESPRDSLNIAHWPSDESELFPFAPPRLFLFGFNLHP